MQHRLIWFRDDLRVNDNAAVSAALNCNADTRISAVFLTADDEWESFGYGKNRLYYTEQLLRSLAIALAQYGVQLQVIRLPNYDAQRQWIGDFCRQERVTDLYFNQEYQWNERMRDHQLAASLTGVNVQSFVDRVLLQPGTVLTGDGRYYSVFSRLKNAGCRYTRKQSSALPITQHDSLSSRNTPMEQSLRSTRIRSLCVRNR